MKSLRSNIPLLVLISINQYGTHLSSFLSFASIGLDSNDLFSLSSALALKTLAIAFCSYFASPFILKLNARYSVIISQVAGVLSSILLWLGIEFRSIPWLIFASLLSGIAAVIFSNAMTLLLRRSVETDFEFKRSQASRGTCAACTFIITGITWPWMFLTLGWQGILLLDILTYCVALLLLQHTPTFKQGLWDAVGQITMTNHKSLTKDPAVGVIKQSINLFNKEGVIAYLLQILVIYAGVGIIPLIASSQEFIRLGQPFNSEYRGFFWAVEAVSLFAANVSYNLMQGRSKVVPLIIAITSLSHILLYFGLLSSNVYLLLVLLFLGRFFMEVQALLYRDQQILRAKTIHDQVTRVSTIASFQSLAMALSPLALFISFSMGHLLTFLIVVGGVQLCFWLLNKINYFLKMRPL